MTRRPATSKGCHACRRMKVKCDEGRPGCARCRRADRDCPGYREQIDLVFRSMNADVAAKTARSHQGGDADLWATRCNTSPPSIPGSSSLQPSTKWEANAVAHFFQNYVSAPVRDTQGYLDFLPELSSRNPDVDCLKYSLLAVSVSNLANVCSIEQLRTRSRHLYGQALRSVSSALQGLDDAQMPCLIASIFLLQKYEIVNGTLTSLDPHQAALARLLLMRGPRSPESLTEQSLFQTVHGRMRVAALDGRSPNPMRCDVDAAMLSPHAMEIHLWQLLHDVAESSSQIQSILEQWVTGAQVDITDLIGTLRGGYSTHSRLLLWHDEASSDLKYQTRQSPVNPTHDSDQSAFTTKFHLFADIQQGAMWIGYWCSRIRILQNLSLGGDILRRLHDGTPDFILPEKGLQAQIVEAADDICASAACMLGEVDAEGELRIGPRGKALGAFYLLYGLHVVNSIDALPPAQRIWLLDRLLQIGHGWGIKIALRARSTWLEKHPAFRDKMHVSV